MPARTKSGRARDSQKQRVYDSTYARPEGMPVSDLAIKHLNGGRKVASTGSVSIEACQAYVDAVCAQRFFQSRWGQKRIPVGHKVYGDATWDGIDISLPPWSRQEKTILHEIAHALTPRGKGYAAHGPEFAGLFLFLVRQVVGVEAGQKLLDSMREHRVRRSAAAIPEAGTKRVVTQTERREKARVAASKPVTRREAAEAAEVLRRAAKLGLLGNAGTKPREGALAAARALEGHAAADAPIAPPRPVTTRRVASRRPRPPEPVLSPGEVARIQSTQPQPPPPPVGLTELLRLHALDARG